MIQKSFNEERLDKHPESAPKAPLHWFSLRMVTNLSNPKIGALYLSLLPQFVPDGVAAFPFTLALATIHILEGAIWFVSSSWRRVRCHAGLLVHRFAARSIEPSVPS
jgi:threonine/homoserine/homoserine lactone efflux protein